MTAPNIQAFSDKVDKEDGSKSDKQRRGAFYRAGTILMLNIDIKFFQGKNVIVKLGGLTTCF